MTVVYECHPVPPRGSVLEAAVLLYASMRQVRRFHEAVAVNSVHCQDAMQAEALKKNLKEVYGLDDKRERDRHQKEMSSLLNRWTEQQPFTVEKVESVDELRKRVSTARIQNQRASDAKKRMRAQGVIPEGWRP